MERSCSLYNKCASRSPHIQFPHVIFHWLLNLFLPIVQEGTEVVELSEEMKNYVGTWGLVTHADERNAESFFHVTLMAHFLLECLKIANYFGVESPGINNFTSGTEGISLFSNLACPKLTPDV